MKQPLRQMSLSGSVVFDPEARGLIIYEDKELVAYRELMGREPPESESPQWRFTGRKKGDKEILQECIISPLGSK